MHNLTMWTLDIGSPGCIRASACLGLLPRRDLRRGHQPEDERGAADELERYNREMAEYQTEEPGAL